MFTLALLSAGRNSERNRVCGQLVLWSFISSQIYFDGEVSTGLMSAKIPISEVGRKQTPERQLPSLS
jgi:hypothetical protein